ncbi:conserved Plasmodium protein, unknown function [Plasmodium vinckei vinckei]|uniref:CRA domain-containing protein n=1 Tax=Plasmodium vinckei vinckei TaxID=54757 RepID=A0A081IB94_PLAVN|nr:conserved Plasmodium protein, unknown function [Plasmodium vinckei vinckei]KEG00952.1 hypothetical protein YYE_04398 [Plasmodium vinckei vinckei]VEV55634.1 conserved Plasmodium protein, unknown function [Plasmodium vinckei vinckei]
MKHKLHTFFVIICLIVVLYCGGIEGKTSDNVKKNIWLSRFYGHKNGKNAKNEKKIENTGSANKKKNEALDDDLQNADIDTIVKSVLKSENVDNRTLKIINELDEKKNEIVLINKRKNLYKSSTVSMGVVVVGFIMRELASFLVNTYLDNHPNAKAVFNRLLMNKWK